MSPHKNTTTVASKRLDVAEKTFAFLRRLYPYKLYENVAADLGCSAGTIRKMEERGSAPSLPMFCRMVDAYGPPFLYAVTGWEWLDPSLREERLVELEDNIKKALAAISESRK